jgi:hypothetical protein
MEQEAIRVLLISETEHGCSNLRRKLEARGCQCRFGSSFLEATALFGKNSFHMVISTIPFHQYDQLLIKLSKLPSTVFQCFMVEDGCWWLPLAKNANPCMGAPALRANEFMGAIEQVLQENRPKLKMVVRVG